MTPETWRAFYEGRDSVAGDRCPYPEGPEARAWHHGHALVLAEDDRDLPMSADEVARRFARLNAAGT
ncbi:MAG TPA: hypothetical protein VF913_22290 [Xanthobacteraceae bacterium]